MHTYRFKTDPKWLIANNEMKQTFELIYGRKAFKIAKFQGKEGWTVPCTESDEQRVEFIPRNTEGFLY